MKIIKIPKKSGGVRLVYVPTPSLKKDMKKHLDRFVRVSMMLDKHRVVHGFMPCRSPVTNAMPHIGFRYTLQFDLLNFFEHVTVAALVKVTHHGASSKEHRKLFHGISNWKEYFPDGSARQGLPCSPVLANIAFSPIDDSIVKYCDKRAEYTRYADDLTFSFNELEFRDNLLEKIPKLCIENGFPVNHNKTHFQSASQGRRIITGVGVDHNGVHPTRKTRRRLRAALHKKNDPQARGLAEWSKCKPPHYPSWSARKLAADFGTLPTVTLADPEMTMSS